MSAPVATLVVRVGAEYATVDVALPVSRQAVEYAVARMLDRLGVLQPDEQEGTE